MFDIIIPVLDNYDRIIQTLSSIAIQNLKDKAKVYIVIRKDFDLDLSLFKENLNLFELTVNNEITVGEARNYAINKSKGKYIIFLENGDQFYNCYALTVFKNEIENNVDDVIITNYYLTQDDNSLLLVEDPINFANLYGKAYRRKYLKDNKIEFSNTNNCDVDSFQNIIATIGSNTKIVNETTYANLQNNNSNTDYITYYDDLIKNRIYLINNLKKRNFDRRDIYLVLLSTYLFIFTENYNYKDFQEFEELCKKNSNFEKTFESYEEFIDQNEILEKLMENFNTNDNNYGLFLLDEFEKFRNKFRKEK